VVAASGEGGEGRGRGAESPIIVARALAGNGQVVDISADSAFAFQSPLPLAVPNAVRCRCCDKR